MRIPYPKFLLATLLAGVTSVSGAQATAAASTSSTGWSAWLGCWAPAGAPVAGEATLTTCVVPGDAPLSVEIVSLAGDSIVMRSTMTADGIARAVTGEGCSGTETARFSDDGARVYVSGEITCADGPTQRTSGVLSISETGEWIDVHGVIVGEQQNLRVRRSRPVRAPGALGEAERAQITRHLRATEGARVAAGVPVTPARVIDASHALDPRVTEAWVLESSRDAATIAPVDRKTVLALAEANVPERVIDVMVALSYPQHFRVMLADDGRNAVETLDGMAEGGETAHARRMFPDVFGYSLYGPGSCITYSCFAFYRDWNFYNYYRGLAGWDFYGGYGMYPGWGYGGGPIVIVPGEGGGGGGGSANGGGRVVKGQGYRRNGGSGTESAQPRSTAAPSSSGGSTRTATRSSGTSGSTKQPPAERTAKPRKP